MGKQTCCSSGHDAADINILPCTAQLLQGIRSLTGNVIYLGVNLQNMHSQLIIKLEPYMLSNLTGITATKKFDVQEKV